LTALDIKDLYLSSE